MSDINEFQGNILSPESDKRILDFVFADAQPFKTAPECVPEVKAKSPKRQPKSSTPLRPKLRTTKRVARKRAENAAVERQALIARLFPNALPANKSGRPVPTKTKRARFTNGATSQGSRNASHWRY